MCIRKYWCDDVLPPLLSTRHMAMNVDLLVPGSNVFYLRGTTGERVLPLLWASYPSRSVSPSAASAQAIHSFTLIAPWNGSPSPLCARSPPLLNIVRPHRLPLLSGPEQLLAMFRIVLRLRASTLRCGMAPNIFKLSFQFTYHFTTPLGPPRPYLKKLCCTSVGDTSTTRRGACSALRHPLAQPTWVSDSPPTLLAPLPTGPM